MSLLSAVISMIFHVVGWALVALLLGVLSVVVIGILVEGQLDDDNLLLSARQAGWILTSKMAVCDHCREV